jgi:hypothetical protein
MSNHAALFRTRAELQQLGAKLDGPIFRSDDKSWLPLIEAKMIHQFDPRWSSSEDATGRHVVERKDDPSWFPLPRYWVEESEVLARLQEGTDWVVVLRDIARSTDERTAIGSVVSPWAIAGTLMIVESPVASELRLACFGAFNSFVFDYLARQKIPGTHLNPSVFKQLPVPDPATFIRTCEWDREHTQVSWLVPRVIELSCTTSYLFQLSELLGPSHSVFRWDEERRFLLRCELDSAFFHIYGIDRDDVSYIMDTFPIVRRKDKAAYGEYRTKHVILEIYDQMADAASKGTMYHTRLSPSPADPSVAHPRKDEVSLHSQRAEE